jgi:hypothetical protein
MIKLRKLFTFLQHKILDIGFFWKATFCGLELGPPGNSDCSKIITGKGGGDTDRSGSARAIGRPTLSLRIEGAPLVGPLKPAYHWSVSVNLLSHWTTGEV